MHAAVLRAARHGLAAGKDPEPVRVADNEASTVVAEARTERVLGLLDQAVVDGAVVCGEDASAVISSAVVGAAAWSLLVERHMLKVHELFQEKGITHRFLKGATVAHRFYPHPGLRHFVDVDVLVPAEEISAAGAELEAAGHVRGPELREGFLAEFGKSVPLTSASGIEVDLHRTLVSAPFGIAAGPEALWERPEAVVRVGGCEVPTMDPVAAFLHACAHEATSAPALGSLRDVVQVGDAVNGASCEIADLASRLRLTAPVGAAVRETSRLLGWDTPEARSMAQWSVSAQERRWLDAYRASNKKLVLAGLLAARGPRARLRYVRAVVFPSLDMAARRGSWVGRALRAGSRR